MRIRRPCSRHVLRRLHCATEGVAEVYIARRSMGREPLLMELRSLGQQGCDTRCAKTAADIPNEIDQAGH
jgi:hypothetical protein